jgi:hypothetical protein
MIRTGYEDVVEVRLVWWTLWTRYAVYKFCSDGAALGHCWYERLSKTYRSERIAKRRKRWVCQLLAAGRW